jgi:hypothetical protein
MSSINNFHDVIAALVDLEDELSPIAKTIALFRIAIDYGSQSLGIATMVHLMSKMLTVTLAIMIGNNEATYESLLEEFKEYERVEGAVH